MPSGSHLLLTHATSDLLPDTTARLAALYQDEKTVRGATTRSNLRTAAEVAELVRNLELLPPGLVPLDRWRPNAAEPESGKAVWAVGGVGRKP